LAGLVLADARDIFLRRLLVILRDRGMNKSKLAKALKVERSTVTRWFDMEVSAEPGFETIGRIADVLGTTPAELFVDSEVPPARRKPPDPKERAMYALEILRAELNKDS
jgi:transcriptional regulator with XRE-family HTH domain